MDEHPHAPPSAVAEVFSGSGYYLFLSTTAIERIRRMSQARRRQLESLAAMLFPDVETIRGSGKLFSGAHAVADAKAYMVPDNLRLVDRDDVETQVARAEPAIAALNDRLVEVFGDPELAPTAREKLADEIEDVLIGRLEREQPQINVELLVSVLKRSLARISISWKLEAYFTLRASSTTRS